MSIDSLAKLIAPQRTGGEPFHANGAALAFDLLSFWKWSSSDLVSNALRGRLAEFLVARSLGISDGVRGEWDAYDLRTSAGLTLEVKSAAYLQTWAQKSFSSIQFGIAPTRYWDAQSNTFKAEIRRQADVYVFALLAHQDKATLDPMNVAQWHFFVLPTAELNAQMPSQKTLRLSRLRQLGARECGYHQLSKEIESLKHLPFEF